MKYQKLTESEARCLADTIATEIRTMGLTGRICRPQEIRRHIRARVIQDILAVRDTDNKVARGDTNR